jgi:hypothetical protein
MAPRLPGGESSVNSPSTNLTTYGGRTARCQHRVHLGQDLWCLATQGARNRLIAAVVARCAVLAAIAGVGFQRAAGLVACSPNRQFLWLIVRVEGVYWTCPSDGPFSADVAHLAWWLPRSRTVRRRRWRSCGIAAVPGTTGRAAWRSAHARCGAHLCRDRGRRSRWVVPGSGPVVAIPTPATALAAARRGAGSRRAAATLSTIAAVVGGRP